MIRTLYDKFQSWSVGGSVYIISDLHFDDVDCKYMDENWLSPEEHVKLINSIVHKSDTLIVLGDVGNVEWVKSLKAGYKVLITGNHDTGADNYKRVNKICKIEFPQLSKDRLDKPFQVDLDGPGDYYATRHEVFSYVEGEIKKDFQRLRNTNNNYRNIIVHKQDKNLVTQFYYEVEYSEEEDKWYYLVNYDNYLFDEIYTGPLTISDKIILSHEPIYGFDFLYNIHGHDHNKYNKGDRTHLNVASNVCGYTPINLGDIIKSGVLSNIKSIHRETIDNATERKKLKNANRGNCSNRTFT